MSLALFLRIGITTFIVLALAALAGWARKHPNRSPADAERIRMPKIVAIIGWLVASAGLLTGLAAFTSPDAALGARIAPVAIMAAGLALVGAYCNFYVAPRTYEIAFRSVFGKEHVRAYSDIGRYRVSTAKGQRFLTMRFTDGTKLSLNINTFDLTPALRAMDFHHATGRWPVRPEAPQEDAAR
ncbi:hypothetical protein OL239_18625 [Arthrobacter sp. ATA002]|uniref:hypothetical protein n=1 Tax=Arthrobacter sp. ATA002 TaxID=2991715 RepID=UPI0022A73313|nr:hypothetical protein [Arthrobacter sp. ATA002]WAP51720.1 hypothetical protein OL239_18625 [Arthrobacter sp. ATA002]